MIRRIGRTPRPHRAADDVLRRQIDEVEIDLRREDPAFVRRFRRLQRAATVNALTVFAFLAIGAVLITAGVATASAVWAFSGILALLVACTVDHRHRRAMLRGHHDR